MSAGLEAGPSVELNPALADANRLARALSDEALQPQDPYQLQPFLRRFITSQGIDKYADFVETYALSQRDEKELVCQIQETEVDPDLVVGPETIRPEITQPLRKLIIGSLAGVAAVAAAIRTAKGREILVLETANQLAVEWFSKEYQTPAQARQAPVYPGAIMAMDIRKKIERHKKEPELMVLLNQQSFYWPRYTRPALNQAPVKQEPKLLVVPEPAVVEEPVIIKVPEIVETPVVRQEPVVPKPKPATENKPALVWDGVGGTGLIQLLLRTPDRRWQSQANCMGVDPDLFFPERGASTREAKEVCRACEVREDCLEYALSNGEKFGIWGGLSERERRKVRRRRAMERRGVVA